MTGFDTALFAESRPHERAARVSSVPVMRGAVFTVARTGDWALAAAFVRARLAL